MKKAKVIQLKQTRQSVFIGLLYVLAILVAILISIPAYGQNFSPEEADPSLAEYEPYKNVLPEQDRRSVLVKQIKTIVIGNQERENPQDSISALINQFYVDQFRHSQDPEIPNFMFLSKKADLAMGIGGQIMIKGLFDWNGSIPTPGFSIYQIPIPKNPASKQRLYGNAAGTGLHFVIIGKNRVIGNYTGYIEAGFDGYQYVGLKLKKAYFTFRDFTIGYTKSTFSDPAAEPEQVDGARSNGLINKTTILVRWMHNFKKHWNVAASLEMPRSSVGADGVYTKSVSDYVPDLAALLQYQWLGGANHVRLSGLLRSIPYRDLVTGKNHSVVGWGAQISAIVNIFPRLSVMALSSVGQGHGSYTSDLQQGSYDLIADPGRQGRLYAPTSVTVTAGIKYYIVKNLYTNLTLGTLRYLPKGNPRNSEYKYGQYLATNLFWNITPRIKAGVEYLAGKRMNFDGSHANANRLMAMFMYQF